MSISAIIDIEGLFVGRLAVMKRLLNEIVSFESRKQTRFSGRSLLTAILNGVDKSAGVIFRESFMPQHLAVTANLVHLLFAFTVYSRGIFRSIREICENCATAKSKGCFVSFQQASAYSEFRRHSISWTSDVAASWFPCLFAFERGRLPEHSWWEILKLHGIGTSDTIIFRFIKIKREIDS